MKPFMLVVCKDTDHATWVEQFVKSDEFRSGAYRNKTIIVHSKQKGAETEANTRLLLDVENPKNPVEIVIHVNMLKEGWDVNNLYTGVETGIMQRCGMLRHTAYWEGQSGHLPRL